MSERNPEQIAASLSEAQQRAVIVGDWDRTPDSVSYVCPFGDLHGCYRHAHAVGLSVRSILLSKENSRGTD